MLQFLFWYFLTKKWMQFLTSPLNTTFFSVVNVCVIKQRCRAITGLHQESHWQLHLQHYKNQIQRTKHLNEKCLRTSPMVKIFFMFMRCKTSLRLTCPYYSDWNYFIIIFLKRNVMLKQAYKIIIPDKTAILWLTLKVKEYLSLSNFLYH